MGKAGRSPAAVRATLGKTVLHGIVGWGVLVALVASFLAARIQSAQSYRTPLPDQTATLSAAELHAWKSFPMYRREVPILEYHGVSGPPTSLSISRKLFVEQMTALKVGGFHPISMAQYLAFTQGHYQGLPPRPILLTFDDGRLDAYRSALSVIKGLHFHAVDIVVPGWVTSNHRFSQDWPEMQQLESSGRWDIESHFGYGHEWVRINKAGRLGGAFADLQYLPRSHGKPGRLETFAQFRQRFATNMLWSIRELRQHVPGYQPIAMAIPRGDYGQGHTNDRRIPHFVISWLDKHFPVVFGGDYLARSQGRPFQIGGRFGRRTPQIDYRLTMMQRDILPVLYCRLRDYARRTPIWKEYLCKRRAKKKPQVNQQNDGDERSLGGWRSGQAPRASGGMAVLSLSPGPWRAPAGRRPPGGWWSSSY